MEIIVSKQNDLHHVFLYFNRTWCDFVYFCSHLLSPALFCPFFCKIIQAKWDLRQKTGLYFDNHLNTWLFFLRVVIQEGHVRCITNSFHVTGFSNRSCELLQLLWRSCLYSALVTPHQLKWKTVSLYKLTLFWPSLIRFLFFTVVMFVHCCYPLAR